MFYFFTLIYIFNFFKCYNNPLKIPLQKFKKTNFYENNIYININIGTPSQKIPLKISISSNPTFITNYSFNQKKSSTYYNKSNIKYIFKENIDKAIESNDIFRFGKNIFSKVDFYLTNNTNYSILGLGRKIYDAISGGKWDDWNNEYNDISDFLTGLKNYKIINKKTFSFKFNKNNFVQIIFGLEYNEMDTNLIIFKDYYRNIMDSTWDLKFDNILIGKKNIKNDLSATLDIQLNTIIANKNIKSIFFKNFFEKYIQKGFCYEVIIEKNIIDKFSYSYFYCNNDYRIKIKELNDINFYIKNINLNFTFTFLDLFEIFDNKLYFLILFRNDNNSLPWIFGIPFFKKYEIIFNLEKEEIVLYKNNQKKLSFLNIIILFFLIIFIIIFQYLKLKKNKFKENQIEMVLI